jgi:hypothetical protein
MPKKQNKNATPVRGTGTSPTRAQISQIRREKKEKKMLMRFEIFKCNI